MGRSGAVPCRRAEVEIRQVARPRTSATPTPPNCASRRTGCGPRPPPSTSLDAGKRALSGVRRRSRVVDAVWRMESAKLIAALTRIVARRRGRRGTGAGRAGRGAGAVAGDGCARTSRAPGSWPSPSTARSTGSAAPSGSSARPSELGQELEIAGGEEPDSTAALDEDVGDDLLRLVFIACHPVLSREARVALTLRLIGGLTTDEIARAFLVAEPTVAQRIVRAKRTLAAARVPVRGAAAAPSSRRGWRRCSR